MRWAYVTTLVALTGAMLAVLWLGPFWPTHDGPQHPYTSWIASQVSAGQAPYAAIFDETTQISARGFALIFTPLLHWMSWKTATRLTLSLGLLLLVGGGVALSRQMHVRRAWLGLFTFGMAFQWSFWMGFYPFLIATGAGLCALAVAARADWSRLIRVLIGALLLLTTHMHAFVGVLTGGGIFALGLARDRSGSLARRIGGLMLIEGPAAVLAIAALMGQPSLGAVSDTQATTSWYPLALHLEVLPRTLVPGPAWLWGPVVGLILVGLVSLFARLARRTLSGRDLALGIAGTLYLVGAVVSPFHISGWQCFAPRFLPLGAVLIVFSLPLERIRSRRRYAAAAVALTLFPVAHLAWTEAEQAALEARFADAYSLASASPRGGDFRLPIVIDSEGLNVVDWWEGPIPLMEPLRNLGALVALESGGIVPYLFATTPQVHAITTRAWHLPIPEMELWSALAEDGPFAEGYRSAALDLLASQGAAYDDVILYAAPDVHEHFAWRGYTSEWSRGRGALLRFVGCPLELSIPPAPDSGPRTLEVGWQPLQEGTRYQIDQAFEVRLQTGCGPVWARVFVDRDGDRAFSEGDLGCRDADDQARFLFEEGPTGVQLVCNWR